MKAAGPRRRTIREVLTSQDVKNQTELLDALARKGVHTTQSVLSRDLRAMRVAKRGGRYELGDVDPVTPLEALRTLLRGSVAAGPNLVVVRCEPGAAGSVARALEAEEIEGLLGTVAGDDTVFVAVDGTSTGSRVRDAVRALLLEQSTL